MGYFGADAEYAKNRRKSGRGCRGLGAEWHRRLPYHISVMGFTLPAIIKPGLWPSSKLLFGDKSILQSQADGHLASAVIGPSPTSPCDAFLRQMLNCIRPAD